MSLTYTPFAETPAIDRLGQDLHMNLSDGERLVSGILGTALFGSALSRSDFSRWLLLLAGSALLRRGYFGHCPAYELAGVDHRHQRSAKTPVRASGQT